MGINELRIGNFVKHENEIKKVIGIISGEEDSEIWLIDKEKKYWRTSKVEGYEISDEILSKLGLRKIKLDHNLIGYGRPCGYGERLEILLRYDGKMFFITLGEVKFIHELQNEKFIFYKKELFEFNELLST